MGRLPGRLNDDVTILALHRARQLDTATKTPPRA
jgi:hypothetical protein